MCRIFPKSLSFIIYAYERTARVPQGAILESPFFIILIIEINKVFSTANRIMKIIGALSRYQFQELNALCNKVQITRVSTVTKMVIKSKEN